MGFLSREQRYVMLCRIKRQNGVLTAEEQKFIEDYALEKFAELMQDPEVVAVLQRLAYR